MIDFISALAAPLSAVIVAIIEWRAHQDRKALRKAKEEEAVRLQQREEEARLSMEMVSATMQLALVSANALAGGHNNGNVERAYAAADEAQKKYQSFLQKVAAHNIT